MKTIILYNKKLIRMSNSGLLCKTVCFFLSLISVWSCNKDDESLQIAMAGPLTLSVSNTTVVLNQKKANTQAVAFSWTTGSNQGTGASISYQFQMDVKGRNFASAITLDLGKANYSQGFTVAQLNDSLLRRWNIPADIAKTLEARVIATINSPTVKPDTSNLLTISVTPYTPVTSTLYMVGDATPSGWNIGNATQMTPDASDPTIFTYQGLMNVGDYKFPANRNTDWGQDMYMRDPADSTKIYLHKGGASDDSKFHIYTGGRYKIVVSLLDLTISVTKLPGPAYNNLYMVGDASPNGWDISNATQLVQDPGNPFHFYYDGVLTAGDFKFPVNRNTDWSQNMYMREPSVADSSKIYLHIGGASDDNKWHIYSPAFYSVKLDLSNNTITKTPVTNLYMVGSATPIGWNIGNAIQLVQDPGNRYVYTYTGAMTAGEFKFPVNRNSDWGQDMFMKTDDTHMYYHHGGASDDNKWSITTAGNYLITINIQTMSISIQQQ